MKRTVKRAIRAAIIALTITTVSQSAWAEMRTWTSVTGEYTIKAELVGFVDDKARLKRTDGRVIRVPMKMLCTADRRLVNDWLAKQEKPVGDAPGLPVDKETIASIELVNGTKIKGQVTGVSDDHISVQVKVGEREYLRKYALARIHTVTVGERRIVFNDKSADDRPGSPTGSTPDSKIVRRTRIEIDSLLDKVGHTPPDWWDSAKLNYPETLDLSWPSQPPRHWDARRNMGQYIWDIINPNPGKWKEGVRLMHHLLKMHATDPQKQ